MVASIWMIVLLVVGVIVVGAIIAIAAVSARKETTASVAAGEGSYFDGNTWQLIGYRILSALVNIITLSIAYPWMLCIVQRWEVKHTVIHGRRLKFNGHGHQLIGKYLLWVFLTIITLGIYGIWLGLGMKKWVVKHTVYADEEKPVDSYFSGGAGGYLGIHILLFILTLFTLGIGKAWADKMVLKWEAKHTHIGGSPLEFNGTGGQLFVKYLLLVLLIPLTLGIYALFFTVIYKKWEVKHTEAVYQTPEIQAKAKAHELTAVQDFAKYRIAASDQEIAAMKSGYTGKEDQPTLEQMAEDGNSFAAYHLAKQLKGENALYEDKALELLQKAANGKVHSALLDLAKQLPAEQKASMLTEAAQCGNAEASWLLVAEYKNANNLPQAAYWFKVAMEWGVAEATACAAEYDELVKNIALQLSESRVMSEPSKRKISPVVWCGVAVAGILLLVGIFFSIMFASAVNDPSRSFMGSCIIRVNSYSMAPEIEPGDVIYLDDDISNVLIGDIIAFIYDEYGNIAVSRVHDIVTNDDGEIRYITKGDNNESQDANPVHPGNVIGVYKHKATFIGEILGSFQRRAAIDVVGITTNDWETPLEGDGSKSSPYLIKNAYDYQKYISYPGENYGVITKDFELCTDYLFHGNNESNRDCFQQQVEKGYLRFQNEDVDVTYNGIVVDCKNRVNISDISHNNTDTTFPTEPSADFDTALLIGDWVGWSGSFGTAGDRQLVPCVHISFSADGTFSAYEMKYVIMDDGSYMEPTTRHTYGGDYQVEGSSLILHYTYFNSGSPDQKGKEVTTTHDIAVSGTKMHINNLGYYGEQYDELHKGMSAKDVVGHNPSQKTLSSADIVGNWVQYKSETGTYQDYMTGVSHTSAGIRRIMWEFSADGTYTYSSYFFVESGNQGELYYDGKYWTDKDIFGTDGTYSVSNIESKSNLATIPASVGMDSFESASVYSIELTNDGLLIEGELFISDNS